MSEPEFQAWQIYAARRMLPQRRMELYMAQIAMQVAMLIATHRGERKDFSLADFLFDPAEPEAEPTAEEEAEFFDFRPRKPKGNP